MWHIEAGPVASAVVVTERQCATNKSRELDYKSNYSGVSPVNGRTRSSCKPRQQPRAGPRALQGHTALLSSADVANGSGCVNHSHGLPPSLGW